MSAVPTPTPQDIRIEDDDFSQLVYTGQWRTIPSSDEWQFSGGTQHLSYAKGSEFSVSFNGSYVWYISDTNYDHGRFRVSVDGRVFDLTGDSPMQQNDVVLFSMPLDDSREHTLVVTNTDDLKAVTLDCIVYRPVERPVSTSSAPTSQQTDVSGTRTPSSSHSRTPAGVYIGIALGSTAFVLLALLLAFILVERRRRHRKRQQPPPYVDATIQPLTWSSFPQPSRTPSPAAQPQQLPPQPQPST